MDVHVKFDDSRSNHSRDIRAALFVMADDKRTTSADRLCGNRVGFPIKIKLYKLLVLSVLLYGSMSGTLTADLER